MAQINSREIAFLGAQTLTTSGSGPDINLPMGYGSIIFSVSSSTVTGTTPSFSFFIQSKLRQAQSTDTSGLDVAGTTGSIYDDLLAFTAITNTVVRIARTIASPIIAGTSGTSGSLAVGVDYVQQDAQLTAGNYRLGALGNLARVKWVVSGTSPSGVFGVTAQFIPYGM